MFDGGNGIAYWKLCFQRAGSRMGEELIVSTGPGNMDSFV